MKNTSPRRRLAEVEIEELSTLLGPPPILSSENEAHYKRILKEFYACLGPADFFEVMLMRQFVDDLWVGQRYRRPRRWQSSVGTDKISNTSKSSLR